MWEAILTYFTFLWLRIKHLKQRRWRQESQEFQVSFENQRLAWARQDPVVTQNSAWGNVGGMLAGSVPNTGKKVCQNVGIMKSGGCEMVFLDIWNKQVEHTGGEKLRSFERNPFPSLTSPVWLTCTSLSFVCMFCFFGDKVSYRPGWNWLELARTGWNWLCSWG